MKVNDNTEMSEKELLDCIAVAHMTKKLMINHLTKLMERGGEDSLAHLKEIRKLLNDIHECNEDIISLKRELEIRGEDNE